MIQRNEIECAASLAMIVSNGGERRVSSAEATVEPAMLQELLDSRALVGITAAGFLVEILEVRTELDCLASLVVFPELGEVVLAKIVQCVCADGLLERVLLKLEAERDLRNGEHVHFRATVGSLGVWILQDLGCHVTKRASAAFNQVALSVDP